MCVCVSVRTAQKLLEFSKPVTAFQINSPSLKCWVKPCQSQKALKSLTAEP